MINNKTKLYLYEDANLSKVNIPYFVKQWNEMGEYGTQYKTTYISTLNTIQEESTILVNKHITPEILKSIDNYLGKYPNSSLCIFLSPREITLLTSIEELMNKHRQANIGTILKPTQFSKVKSFIDSATTKEASLKLEDNWEEFNFSEFF